MKHTSMKYLLLSADSPNALTVDICDRLSKDWELHGTVVTSGPILYQAMTKYSKGVKAMMAGGSV